MIATARHYANICLQPHHLKRTGTITLIVGTWLTVYNLGDVLFATGFSAAIAGKIFLNYLTPFIVFNWGLVSRDPEETQ